MDKLQYAPAYLQTLSQIKNGEEVSLARFINPVDLAAIQAGTSTYNAFTDISSAFTSGAMALFVPQGIYSFAGDLPPIPGGAVVRGAGSGEYSTQGNVQQGTTIFQRTDAGTATSSVLTLGDSATIETLQVRPANFAATEYSNANYPTGTGNVGIGVKMGNAGQLRHVNAQAFPIAGFQIGTVATLERCYAYQNGTGYLVDPDGATDGSLINCIAMFNTLAGADLRNNFWQIIGGRYEWNARYGAILGAESLSVGAIYDRNGFAGIWTASGMWGKTITGNYFSRNGAGGDGQLGRWSFSTPTHPSYVAVPAGQSCHIQIDYEHSITIQGNRFRPGQDDGDGGSASPQFVYGTASSDGATPANGINISGNIGDKAEHAIPGFATPYGASGVGAVAGGTDTSLVNYLNTGLDVPLVGVSTAFYSGDTEPQNVTTFSVDVPRSTSGRITVRACVTGSTNLFDVYFATNAADGGYTTGTANLLGTSTYSSSTMAANTSDARYNTVTINLKSAQWVDYTVHTT